MSLEYFEAGRQHIVQFRIPRQWDQRVLERSDDCLVIGDLIVDIGLVESRAMDLVQLKFRLARLFDQRLAGVVVLGRNVKFF
jgi:hypothetical protein